MTNMDTQNHKLQTHTKPQVTDMDRNTDANKCVRHRRKKVPDTDAIKN